MAYEQNILRVVAKQETGSETLKYRCHYQDKWAGIDAILPIWLSH